MKQLLAQVTEIWSGGTPTQRALGVLSVLVVLLGLGGSVYFASRPDFALLFGGLDPADAGAVVEEVRSAGVEAEVRSGGTAVYVPRAMVDEMRMKVSQAGLPRGSSSGFELFDKSAFGQSDFVQNVNYLRALQGELARTVESYDAVESARVQITPAKRSAFVQNSQPAKASVVVRTRAGRKLSPERVTAITLLVAGAVEGLDPEMVSVMDTDMTVLSKGGEDPLAVNATNQFELRRNEEEYLRAAAQAMLDRAQYKADVRVALEMDFPQLRQTSEVYRPDGTVLRETINSRTSAPSAGAAGGSGGAGGPVGAKEALDEGLALAPRIEIPTEESEETIETSYGVGRTVTEESKTAPVITRMSVSLVLHKDHDTDLAAVEEIVKAAVNFNRERGDVLKSMVADFKAPEIEPLLPPEEALPLAPVLIERGVQVLGILGALFLLFRMLKMVDARESKRQSLLAAARQADAEHRLLHGHRTGPDGQPHEVSDPSLLQEMVRASVQSDPGSATRVLQAWLRDGGNN